MLGRCYCPKEQLKNPTYVGCSVSEEWHNYTNFKQWFNEQEYQDDCHLDKDIKVPFNRVYSKDTCLLVPAEINTILTDGRSRRGNTPVGVHYRVRNDRPNPKYTAQIETGKKTRHLGHYNTCQEAWNAYVPAKIERCKSIAKQYNLSQEITGYLLYTIDIKLRKESEDFNLHYPA